jgi:hypothetical protein
MDLATIPTYKTEKKTEGKDAEVDGIDGLAAFYSSEG